MSRPKAATLFAAPSVFMNFCRSPALRLTFLGALAVATTCANAAPLRIVGSDLLAPALTTVISKQAATRNLDIEIDCHGTLPGARSLLAGSGDVGLLFDTGSGEDLEAAGYVRLAFAYAVAAVVVSKDNPMESISIPQLRKIYCGDGAEAVVRWGDVGVGGDWASEVIDPTIAARRNGLIAGVFRRQALADTDLVPGVEFGTDYKLMLDRAADARSGLTICSPVVITRRVRLLPVSPGEEEKPLAPSTENIEGQAYPLQMAVDIVYRRGLGAKIAPLAEILMSPEAGEALRTMLLTPLSEPARPHLLDALRSEAGPE